MNVGYNPSYPGSGRELSRLYAVLVYTVLDCVNLKSLNSWLGYLTEDELIEVHEKLRLLDETDDDGRRNKNGD